MTFAHEPSALHELAVQNVPRYTSYPTAPHFTPQLGAGTYSGWLRAAAATQEPVSLYLHVPFCRTICNYCGCNTRAARRDEPIRDYAETLRQEIALVSDITGRLPVTHVHWGGGTPSLLPVDCMETLVEELHMRFDFLPYMEHAIELDPRYVSVELAQLLSRIGINRASLGVQDLDPAVQIAIGRVQSHATVARAVDVLRGAGIEALNFDVMYGLPRQTAETVLDTAGKVVDLQPQRISLFGYAHVPWMKTHQRLIDEATLPGPEQRIALARTARQRFNDAGYAEIGIDHFALPGDTLNEALKSRLLRRNFQGYTTDRARTLIGLGASSIGCTPFGLAQNASDNGGWRRAIEAGNLPIVRGRAYRGEDRLRGAVIEQLLCYFAADIDRIAAQEDSKPELLDASLDSLADLVKAGWISREGRHIVIIRNAAEIARVVAARFDAYLGSSSARHSVAV